MYDPVKPMQGLFRGFLLARIYRLLITGPGTTYDPSEKSTGRLPRGILNGLEKPTPATIGYAAVVVSSLSPTSRHLMIVCRLDGLSAPLEGGVMKTLGFGWTTFSSQ